MSSNENKYKLLIAQRTEQRTSNSKVEGSNPFQETKKCTACNLNKIISQFYNKSGRSGTYPYCKTCWNNKTIEKGRKTKTRIINYMGGKCTVCEEKRFYVLVLHHTEKKDPNFNTIRYWSWDRIIQELKKCTLVCQNCHLEIHYNLNKHKEKLNKALEEININHAETLRKLAD